ncbi:MAG TPA: DUF2141 domain-containing protein [Caulobacteraceae bacterium]|jgi:uncharacterized protein (DUF2141 family)|nr:DUF2141 domain-containing protein [Caulobacteraceae bacterium]
MSAALTLSAIDAAQPPGGAEAACRPDEAGPALRVLLTGLKDRKGILRIELYPANDADFLADDTALIRAGKDFRRVDIPAPAEGKVELCIRAPRAGVFAVAILHDRNQDRKFSPFVDGVGFPNDPKLGFSKPKAAQASVAIGPGLTQAAVTMKYWNGLSMGRSGAR